ncbi:MAG: HAMP domain-containing histidine kinase [Actinomycetota bacterium]|nr:HAMP domain-containing histidine kinase [Actinomycetota bacterium]
MRARLIAAIAGVAAAAVMLLAVPLALVLQNNYRDDELLRLQRDTVAATREIDLSAGRDPIEVPPTSDTLAVYNRAGERVAGHGPRVADPLVREAIRSGRIADQHTEGKFVVAVPLLTNERVTGAARGVRDDSAAVSRTHRVWLALGGLAAGIVILAIGAALLLSRRLASPLERLASAARRLGHGDFSVRSPRTGVAEADSVAEALDVTAERLGDLVSRERAFSSNASHQLRTPLAALRLELEALEMRGNPPAEVSRALAEVDRLQATIDTLLSVARDSADRSDESDLPALLGEIEERWHGPLAAKGRPLRVAVNGDDLVAQASPSVVSEVIGVLVDNAYRHGSGAVTVTARAAAGSIAVDVEDEGPGFSGDPEPAFERRSGSADGEGHGIGLDLARSLAVAEGGRLLVTRAAPAPILTLLLPRRSSGQDSDKDA